jgi:hypothetical protein
MPSKTPRQQRFFGFLKSHPGAARAKGIPPSVVEEFVHKPKGGYKKKGQKLGSERRHLMPKRDSRGFY